MPWGNDGNNGQGPWGQKPSGGGGKNTPPTPPDLEEILKKGRDQFDGIFGGGDGKKPILLVALVAFGLWLATGFYTVDAGEEGIVTRFGAFHHKTGAGLHYRLPTPIEKVYLIAVERTNRIEVGVRSSASSGRSARKVKVLEESLMLTGDENISDVSFEVQWKISSASEYLFNIKGSVATIKSVAESAMREVVGQTDADGVLTTGKSEVERKAREIMQAMLNEYNAGVEVLRVKLQDVAVPSQVSAAYKDVQNAKIDRESAINQAEAYRNDILPRARGEAEQLIQQAEGYKAQIVAQAEGNASRFVAVYDKYRVAKDVTRERIYLETMEEVLGGVDKIILDQSGNGAGVVPYLPLNELRKR